MVDQVAPVGDPYTMRVAHEEQSGGLTYILPFSVLTMGYVLLSRRYDRKGVVIVDRRGRSADEFEIALHGHHITDRKRHHHGFKGIEEMGAISLPQRCGIESRDLMVRKDLLIPCEQARFARPPDFRCERGGQEVRDIANPLTNADELPVEEPWLGLLPEEIAGMYIVMDEGAWAVCKHTHHLATLARIVNSGGVERYGNGAPGTP